MPRQIVRMLTGTASLLGLCLFSACGEDYLTGQDPEPAGPLLVTRLTLSDTHGRFTDTSAPSDCSLAELKTTKACVNTPFKDMFSPIKSPPNPDSASKLRVVFNKVPLKLNGRDVELLPENGSLPSMPSDYKLSDPNVIKLSCSGCTGIPAGYTSLSLSGSDLSPDPTTFDYGPALQMEVLTEPPEASGIPSDPLRALEPGTTYTVEINPGLSGRSGTDRVLLDDKAKTLLTFTTEDFQIVETRVTNSGNKLSYEGSDGDVAGLTNDGAIGIVLNAGVDHNAWPADLSQVVQVSVKKGKNGTPMMVPVVITNGVQFDGESDPVCDHGAQRQLYIAPVSGMWMAGLTDTDELFVEVTLTLQNIKDIAQDAAHTPKAGKHVLMDQPPIVAVVKQGYTAAEHAVLASTVTTCTMSNIVRRSSR